MQAPERYLRYCVFHFEGRAWPSQTGMIPARLGIRLRYFSSEGKLMPVNQGPLKRTVSFQKMPSMATCVQKTS